MEIIEALKLVGLEGNADEATRHAAFAQQRNGLEQKIANAPTPGLKAKYREALERLDEAIACIETAQDHSAHPVLAPDYSDEANASASTSNSEGNVDTAKVSAHTAPVTGSLATPTSHTKELIIAVLVICMLCGAGGAWWWQQNQSQQAKLDDLLAQIHQLTLDAPEIIVNDLDKEIEAYSKNASESRKNSLQKAWTSKRASLDEQAKQVAAKEQAEREATQLRAERERLQEEEAKHQAELQQKQVAKEQAALLQKELNALLLRYNAVEHKRKIFDQQLKDEEEVLRKIKSSKRDQLTLAPYFDKHFSLQSSYVAWLKKQVAQNSASLHAANARDFMRDKNVALSSKEMDKSEKALDQLITDVAIAKQEKLVHPLFDWVSGQWNHHGQNYLVAFRNDFEIPQAYLDEVTKEMDGMFIIGKTLPTQAEHKLALAAALFGQQHPFYQKWDKNHKNAKHAIELLDRGETWSNDGVRLPRDYEAQLKTMNKLIPKDNERLQRIQSYAAELTKQLSILEKGLHSSAMNLAEKLLLHEQSKATTNKLSYDHQRQINEQLTTSLAEHISKHFNSVEAVKKESNALMNLGNINVYPMGQLNDSKVKAIINQGQFFACQKLIQETDNKSTSRLLLLAAQSCQQALKYSNNGFDEYMVKNHPHFTWQHTQTFSSRCTGGIGQLTHLEYSHDNKFMLIGRGKSGLIMQLWANPSVFHRHESPSSNNVHKLAPNGRFLASSGSSKSGRKWTYRPYLAEYNDDFTERVPAKLLGSSHVSPITGLDISQNSKYLLVTYMREPAELWDLEKRRRLCTIGKGESENGGFNTGIFAGSDNFIVLTKRKGLMVYQLPEEEKNYYKGPTLKLTKPMNIPYQAFYKLFPITNEPKVYMSQGMCLDLNTGALDIVPVIDESHGIIAVSSDKKLMALKVYDAKLGAGIGIYDRIKQSYLGCIPVNSHDAVAFSKDGSKIAVYSAKHQVWIFEQMSSN